MTDIAWHFTGATLRDERPIPPIGETLIYEGKIDLCKAGYHWSRTPWQALQYAPGLLLHKVRVGGKVIECSDKGVSSERTILASIDATYLCRRFAADEALSVAHLWEMPEIVREYLTTLDEGKREEARQAAFRVYDRMDAAAALAGPSAAYAAWAVISAGYSAAFAAAAAIAATYAAAADAAAYAAYAFAAAYAAYAAWAASPACPPARRAGCGGRAAEFNRRVYAEFDKRSSTNGEENENDR